MTVKLFVALALAAGLSASALAQDYGTPSVRVKPGGESRTGLYIYGAGGVSRGNDYDLVNTVAAKPAMAAGLGPGTPDTKRNTVRAGVGWRFNRYLGIEGGYVDIGRMEFTGTDALGTPFSSRAKLRGGQAAVVVFYPFTEEFAVFAKLGALYSRTTYSDSTGASDDATSVRPYYGVGLQYDFTEAIFGRLEYERYANLGSTLSGKTSFSQTHVGVGLRF